MKKSLLFLMLSMQVAAQNGPVIKNGFHNSFLYFLPNSNNLISVIVREVDNSSKSKDSNLEVFSIAILSINDGKIIKEVPLSDPRTGFIQAFNVSHDGLSFVVLLSSIPRNSRERREGPFVIKKYLLDENRWAWEVKWQCEFAALHLTYSEDNHCIIGASTRCIVFIDSETGSVISTSNKISSIVSNEDKWGVDYDLSKNGKYFAFWWPKFLIFSKDDDAGLLRLLDISWYGLRWLYHLGSIPNYLYVWDVYKDTLYCEFQIPYEAEEGSLAFTENERCLLTENFDFEYQVYSLSSKKLVRGFNQVDSGYPKKTEYAGINCKIISPDANYFTETYHDSILVIDYNSGQLINKYVQTSFSYFPYKRYAMAFSPDSKYFAVVTSSYKDTVKSSHYTYTVERGNKLNLYNTKTWEKIWEKDLSKEE